MVVLTVGILRTVLERLPDNYEIVYYSSDGELGLIDFDKILVDHDQQQVELF